MKTLDCRLRKCPGPVVETRKQLLAEPDEPLTVLVGDDTARQNVSRLALSLGCRVQATADEGGFALKITPGAAPTAETAAPAPGKTVVYVTTDVMGAGNDDLGHILMKNFIFTLAELETPPDAILFVNGGVRLTTEGSGVIEPLEKLACNGADIASCGLCLEFYDLKDKLKVGRPTNMLDTVEQLTRAGRVIRP
ncbi:MAG: sulfurtransferase-like selenium metabolism protein YedF [Trichloromonas sp.]|jgi:selenium metabolism protein YedF|nr:sulfurtransferase-like selenium metabolism protein YedF [Trichloromonas sp.]